MINSFLSKPFNKFLLWIFTGLVICLIGITNVNALSTTTSYSSYSNGTLNGSGKYNYGYLSGGIQNSTTANIGSTISGVSYGFMFYYSQNISLGNTYTLVINFVSSDLLASVTSNWVSISTCNSSSCNENTLISMVKSNPTGYSNKVTFKFNPISVGSVIRFEMGGDNNQPLTGVSNFGISSIQIDVENPSQDIINNNTNNTNNIINNNNSNTQEIIDNQNNLLGNKCSNLMNLESISLERSGTRNYTYTLPTTLSAGTYTLTYDYFSNNSPTTNVELYLLSDSNNYITINLSNSGSNTFTISHSFDTMNFLITNNSPSNSNVTLSNLMLVNSSSSKPYCKYGTSQSKLDDTNNALNNLNDTLNDDSSATFDSSMINLIPNAPITNLLTIPISLLQSILTRANNTCSPISIPFLFNHNITFPCFTLSDYFGSVANTIDLCICFVMIYNIFMLFVSVFEDITTLRDSFLGLYEPQHAVGSYKPRHGKG